MGGVHVIVVGCGRVGSGLAQSLEEKGHSVAVMDLDKKSFRRLPASFGGTAVNGSGFDRDDLEAAGVTGAGALAAVTSGDNTNILSARIARENYEVGNVVARIYDPRRAVIYARLGIPTVATVAWTTDQVLRRLVPDDTEPEWIEPTGAFSVLGRLLPAAWAGRRLGDLEQDGRLRIVGISRAGKAQLATPGLIAQDGDVVYVAALRDAEDELSDRLAASVSGGH